MREREREREREVRVCEVCVLTLLEHVLLHEGVAVVRVGRERRRRQRPVRVARLGALLVRRRAAVDARVDVLLLTARAELRVRVRGAVWWGKLFCHNCPVLWSSMTNRLVTTP